MKERQDRDFYQAWGKKTDSKMNGIREKARKAWQRDKKRWGEWWMWAQISYNYTSCWIKLILSVTHSLIGLWTHFACSPVCLTHSFPLLYSTLHIIFHWTIYYPNMVSYKTLKKKSFKTSVFKSGFSTQSFHLSKLYYADDSTSNFLTLGENFLEITWYYFGNNSKKQQS